MTIEIYKNSFITLDDAELYFNERFNSEKWYSVSEEDKDKLLVTASKKINRYDFLGEKKASEQPMEFPRNYPLPQDIKDAVCEEAISLIENPNNPHLENQRFGIQSISLGAGSVSYRDKGNFGDLCSSVAMELVTKWVKKGYNIAKQKFEEAE